MPRNIVKTIEKNFSDLKAGEKMLISSPEKIADYIKNIPKGSQKNTKQMRLDLAKEMNADNTCPVTTGIFLRVAIQDHLEDHRIIDESLPFWRVIDENHRIVDKLGLSKEEIVSLREKEGLP
ncbi:MAG: hypothetical protein CL735_04615 [Chloroflexi bacterium]|nr:hypothetical protein [Chloroflexota bacterium]